MPRSRGVPGQADDRRHIRGAHRYKRPRATGDWWYAYIPGRGRVALRTQDEAEAERQFRAELARPARPARHAAEATLAVIAASFTTAPHGWTARTKKSATYRATAFAEAMGERGVELPSQLTTAALDAWRDELMATRSAATINRGEDVVRKMLRWAREQTPPLCGPTPMDTRGRLREAERPDRDLIPSPAEVAALVGVLDGPDGHRGLALAVALATASGLRLDELRHLPADTIDDDGVRVRPEAGAAHGAWTSKGHRERKIPLPAAVVEIAREFVAWRDAHDWVLSDGWTGELLARASAILELEPAPGMHDFRRTFATEAVRAGVALTTVQDWMAHRDIRTTQRYLGRYRSDASVVAPAPAAVALLAARAAATAGTVCTRVQNGGSLVQNEPQTALPSGRRRGPKLAAKLAEEKGFEPLEGLHPRRFSRPLSLVTLPQESRGEPASGTRAGTKGGRPRRLAAAHATASSPAPRRRGGR